MAVKRAYSIKGTNDFLVLSCIFFFLCLWAVKDAWYPSLSVSEKHPTKLPVSFEGQGTIGAMYVSVGDSVGEGKLLAEFGQIKMKKEFDAAKKEYTASKNKCALMKEALKSAKENGGSDEDVSEITKNMAQSKLVMDENLLKIESVRSGMAASELLAPKDGKIKEVLVPVYTHVTAGEAILIIEPKDNFYLFNKSLAIFSFIAFFVFLGLHLLA